jgi:hypothetical protein
MAITIVDSDTLHLAAGAGTGTITFTALENDLVVLYVANPGTYDDTSLVTTGYTLAKDLNSAAGNNLLYKKMTSSPDSGVQINQHAGGVQECLLWVLRGQDLTTPEDVAATTIGAGSAVVNGPAITTVTNAAFVLSCAYYFSATDATAGPTGYSNFLLIDDGGNEHAVGAWKEVAVAGAEDPGAFTDAPNTTFDAITWAVRPAASAAGGAKNMLLLGVG